MRQETLFDASDGICPECGGPVEVIDLDTVGECDGCRETQWRRRPHDRRQTTAKYFGVKRTGKRPRNAQARRH